MKLALCQRAVTSVKLSLFVAIDRTRKFTFVELHAQAGKMIAAVPYAIHSMRTDNGIQFTNQARHKYAFHHIFDRVCDEHEIEHCLTINYRDHTPSPCEARSPKEGRHARRLI